MLNRCSKKDTSFSACKGLTACQIKEGKQQKKPKGSSDASSDDVNA